MAKFTMTKTTHGAWNGGLCSSLTMVSAYYKGTSVVWGITRDDDERIIAFYRKRDAVKLTAWANESDWDGEADAVLAYEHATDDWSLGKVA